MGVNFYTAGTYILRAEINTSCGFQYVYKTVYANPSKSAAPSVIYPNPVDDVLFVDLDKIANNQNKTNVTFDVRLCDSQGNVVCQANSKNGVIQFNVSNLHDGVYFVHIYNGSISKPEAHRVIIKH